MWRIVAMGAVPAALIGAGSGLFFSHNFVDYQPMGEVYMAQDSMSYTGSPPAYVSPLLGGIRPFYVAPSEMTDQPASVEPSATENPQTNATLAAANGAVAPSAADRAADAAALQPVRAPDPPGPLHDIGAAMSATFDSQMQSVERELKKNEDPPAVTNLDAPG